MKYDLTCVIPLYGDNCENVSLKMVSSLATQETKYKIRYLFFSDKTVSDKAIEQIHYLLSGRKTEYCVIHCPDTSSGSKRNLGIQLSLDVSQYIWFIDQDDYLVKPNTFDIILDALAKYPFLNLVKIKFLAPDNITDYNQKSIYDTPTMPFLWIIKTEKLRDLRFRTDMEYGSDVPITIELLAEEGYIKFNDDETATFKYTKTIPHFEVLLYYYNYLNDHSYIRKHCLMEKDKKEKEIKAAIDVIKGIREKYEKE